MPVGRRFHYQIGGKGFILHRDEGGARSWVRTGRADTPGRRSATDYQYGVLPDDLDHPEVWDDWTGGFGHAYREPGQPTYHWAENFDARFPRQLVHCQNPMAAAAPVTYDIQRISVIPPKLNASIWTLANRNSGVHLHGGYNWTNITPNTTGSTVVISYGGTDTIRAIAGQTVTVGSGVLVPRLNGSGNPQLILYDQAGNSNVMDFPYLHMQQANDRVWMAIGGSGNLRPALRSILGDPTVTANLTATLLVGDGTYPVNALAVLNDQIIVGAGNGLFFGDQTGTFVNVMPTLMQAASNENCRDLLTWAGGLLFQTSQGVRYYFENVAGATIQEVPISAGRSPIQGYVRCFSSCGPWVYAGRWTGSQSWILATTDIGQLNPRWHPLQRFDSQSIGRIAFDGITTASGTGTVNIPQRMYVAMDLDHAGTAPLYSWMTPDNDGNPLVPQPSFSANYIGSARMDFGAIDWSAPGTPKVFRAVEVWGDSLLSGYRYGDIYYDVDQSGSFTLLGRAQTSPKSTLYFSSGEGSFVTGQSIELRLASFTASPAFSPVYRSIVLRGALQPRSVDLITAVTRIADGMVDAEGGQMRSASTMLKELRDFANPDAQGLQAHQLIDLTGAAQWVKVLAPIEEHEVYQEGESFPEIAATVKMAVLVYS